MIYHHSIHLASVIPVVPVWLAVWFSLSSTLARLPQPASSVADRSSASGADGR